VTRASERANRPVKPYAEARSVAVEDPYKGTRCHGSSVLSVRFVRLLNTRQMGTLDVQEAMGLKVDREAVATLVLPQLWACVVMPLSRDRLLTRHPACLLGRVSNRPVPSLFP
jgi:hypothetical protein